ncbi:hypothetical protein D3C72_2071370 [compost metagenome]
MNRDFLQAAVSVEVLGVVTHCIKAGRRQGIEQRVLQDLTQVTALAHDSAHRHRCAVLQTLVGRELTNPFPGI